MPMVMKSPGLKPIEAQNARSCLACVPCLASIHLRFPLVEPSPNLRFGLMAHRRDNANFGYSDYRVELLCRVENWSAWILQRPALALHERGVQSIPSNAAKRSRTSVSTTSGARPTCLIGRFSQEMLRGWSASTTPRKLALSGSMASNG
jgi:hypothetical protein